MADDTTDYCSEIFDAAYSPINWTNFVKCTHDKWYIIWTAYIFGVIPASIYVLHDVIDSRWRPLAHADRWYIIYTIANVLISVSTLTYFVLQVSAGDHKEAAATYVVLVLNVYANMKIMRGNMIRGMLFTLSQMFRLRTPESTRFPWAGPLVSKIASGFMDDDIPGDGPRIRWLSCVWRCFWPFMGMMHSRRKAHTFGFVHMPHLFIVEPRNYAVMVTAWVWRCLGEMASADSRLSRNMDQHDFLLVQNKDTELLDVDLQVVRIEDFVLELDRCSPVLVALVHGDEFTAIETLRLFREDTEYAVRAWRLRGSKVRGDKHQPPLPKAWKARGHNPYSPRVPEETLDDNSLDFLGGCIAETVWALQLMVTLMLGDRALRVHRPGKVDSRKTDLQTVRGAAAPLEGLMFRGFTLAYDEEMINQKYLGEITMRGAHSLLCLMLVDTVLAWFSTPAIVLKGMLLPKPRQRTSDCDSDPHSLRPAASLSHTDSNTDDAASSIDTVMTSHRELSMLAARPAEGLGQDVTPEHPEATGRRANTSAAAAAVAAAAGGGSGGAGASPAAAQPALKNRRICWPRLTLNPEAFARKCLGKYMQTLQLDTVSRGGRVTVAAPEKYSMARQWELLEGKGHLPQKQLTRRRGGLCGSQTLEEDEGEPGDPVELSTSPSAPPTQTTGRHDDSAGRAAQKMTFKQDRRFSVPVEQVTADFVPATNADADDVHKPDLRTQDPSTRLFQSLRSRTNRTVNDARKSIHRIRAHKVHMQQDTVAKAQRPSTIPVFVAAYVSSTLSILNFAATSPGDVSEKLDRLPSTVYDERAKGRLAVTGLMDMYRQLSLIRKLRTGEAVERIGKTVDSKTMFRDRTAACIGVASELILELGSFLLFHIETTGCSLNDAVKSALRPGCTLETVPTEAEQQLLCELLAFFRETLVRNLVSHHSGLLPVHQDQLAAMLAVLFSATFSGAQAMAEWRLRHERVVSARFVTSVPSFRYGRMASAAPGIPVPAWQREDVHIFTALHTAIVSGCTLLTGLQDEDRKGSWILADRRTGRPDTHNANWGLTFHGGTSSGVQSAPEWLCSSPSSPIAPEAAAEWMHLVQAPRSCKLRDLYSSAGLHVGEPLHHAFQALLAAMHRLSDTVTGWDDLEAVSEHPSDSAPSSSNGSGLLGCFPPPEEVDEESQAGTGVLQVGVDAARPTGESRDVVVRRHQHTASAPPSLASPDVLRRSQ